MKNEIITITTEFIRLDALLKLGGALDTGGQAKFVIQNGEVEMAKSAPCVAKKCVTATMPNITAAAIR